MSVENIFPKRCINFQAQSFPISYCLIMFITSIVPALFNFANFRLIKLTTLQKELKLIIAITTK